MTWISPLLAGITAAIAVPSLLILYFLKLRRRDLEVSSTLLWKKAIEDLQANAPFQRLRRNILLLLQLLILAGVIAALGQPQFTGNTPIGQRHVILIDRSASMDAVDDEANDKSRLDQAKKQALELVESLREPGIFSSQEADQAMVIAFDSRAVVRQPFTTDKSLLAAAIESVGPTDGPTSVEEAFRLAKAHAPKRVLVDADGSTRQIEGQTGGPGMQIHLYSDGRIPDAEKAATEPKDSFFYHALGEASAPNVGIVSIHAERAFDDPTALSVFVGLQNADRKPRTVDAEIIIDGVVAGITTVKVPAAGGLTSISTDENQPAPIATPGTTGFVFPTNRAEGGLLTVRLSHTDGHDALETDDVAWLILPPAKRLAVALVTQSNMFLADVLQSLPLASLDTFTPEEYEQQLSTDEHAFDVVVLDGWTPTVGPDEPSSLPPGRYIILGTVPGGKSGLTEIGQGPPATIIDWSRRHRALRGISFDNLFIGKSRTIDIADGSPARVIGLSDQGPAFIELDEPTARSIVVPFNVAESNWPFELSWVLFMASSLQYLGEDDPGALGQFVRPGETLVERLPMGAQEIRLMLPDGSSTKLVPATDGAVAYGPVDHTGLYILSWIGPAGPNDQVVDGRNRRTVAANLADPLESDLPRIEEISIATQDVQAQAVSRGRAIHRLWPWLILIALTVMLLEWFVYNRKVHV